MREIVTYTLGLEHLILPSHNDRVCTPVDDVRLCDFLLVRSFGIMLIVMVALAKSLTALASVRVGKVDFSFR